MSHDRRLTDAALVTATTTEHTVATWDWKVECSRCMMMVNRLYLVTDAVTGRLRQSLCVTCHDELYPPPAAPAPDPAATAHAQALLRTVAERRTALNAQVTLGAGIGAALERTKQAELTALAWLLDHVDQVVVMVGES